MVHLLEGGRVIVEYKIQTIPKLQKITSTHLFIIKQSSMHPKQLFRKLLSAVRSFQTPLCHKIKQ